MCSSSARDGQAVPRGIRPAGACVRKFFSSIRQFVVINKGRCVTFCNDGWEFYSTLARPGCNRSLGRRPIEQLQRMVFPSKYGASRWRKDSGTGLPRGLKSARDDKNKGFCGTAKAVPFQNDRKAAFFRDL